MATSVVFRLTDVEKFLYGNFRGPKKFNFFTNLKSVRVLHLAYICSYQMLLNYGTKIRNRFLRILL